MTTIRSQKAQVDKLATELAEVKSLLGTSATKRLETEAKRYASAVSKKRDPVAPKAGASAKTSQPRYNTVGISERKGMDLAGGFALAAAATTLAATTLLTGGLTAPALALGLYQGAVGGGLILGARAVELEQRFVDLTAELESAKECLTTLMEQETR